MNKYIVDISKNYPLPTDVAIVHYNDKILCISPETAKWIVLDNENQLKIFWNLKYSSIQKILDKGEFAIIDVKNVVTQLEARHFCSSHVVGVKDSSKTMHFYMTNKCNLHCPHCYMYSGKSNNNELSTTEILNLLSDFKSSGGENITFSGGEPTTRQDFKEIIISAHDIGLKVRILSNGILWNNDMVDKLSPYIDSIQISIDGYSEESNALIRGKGNFEKSLSTIERLLHNNVNTSIAITPSLETLKSHIDEYYQFAMKMSKRFGSKKLLIKFSEGLLSGREICPSEKQNTEYYELMQNLQRKLHGNDYDTLSFARVFREDVIMDNCMFGMLVIASNGDVFFCARTSDLQPCTNIRTTDFRKIMNYSKQAESATVISKLKPCNTCELRMICGAGCRIDEFKKLVYRNNFENIDYNSIAPRKCSMKFKQYFYDLMIKSNKYLFKAI